MKTLIQSLDCLPRYQNLVLAMQIHSWPGVKHMQIQREGERRQDVHYVLNGETITLETPVWVKAVALLIKQQLNGK